MSFIERFESVIELSLEGWGPAELISVIAELGVAACLIAPLVVAGSVASWALRRSAARHAGAIAMAGHAWRGHVKAIKHRS